MEVSPIILILHLRRLRQYLGRFSELSQQEESNLHLAIYLSSITLSPSLSDNYTGTRPLPQRRRIRVLSFAPSLAFPLPVFLSYRPQQSFGPQLSAKNPASR